MILIERVPGSGGISGGIHPVSGAFQHFGAGLAYVAILCHHENVAGRSCWLYSGLTRRLCRSRGAVSVHPGMIASKRCRGYGVFTPYPIPEMHSRVSGIQDVSKPRSCVWRNARTRANSPQKLECLIEKGGFDSNSRDSPHSANAVAHLF